MSTPESSRFLSRVADLATRKHLQLREHGKPQCPEYEVLSPRGERVLSTSDPRLLELFLSTTKAWHKP